MVKYKYNKLEYTIPNKVFIDKISLTYSPPNKTIEDIILGTITNKGWQQTWTKPYESYDNKNNLYCKNAVLDFDNSVGYLQVKPKFKKLNYLRLEYNPSKIDYESLVMSLDSIYEGLASSILSSGTVTRIDIATDIYYISPDQIIIDYSKIKSREVYCFGGNVQTIYVGKNESALRIRMYDKIAQINAHSKNKDKLKSIFNKWTRLELQYRPKSKKLDSFLNHKNIMLPLTFNATPENIYNDFVFQQDRDLAVIKGVRAGTVKMNKSYKEAFVAKLAKYGKSNIINPNTLWNTLPDAIKQIYPNVA